MENTEEVLGLDISLRQITAPTTYTPTGDEKNKREMLLQVSTPNSEHRGVMIE